MSDKADTTTLKPGMVVNGYLIERELGRGAMAVVYLTRQLDLDRPVALKVMSSEFASKKDYVRRFFNEVRTAAALSHPNIIQAYDAGVAFNNTYYFAMEYVEGESMLRRIERSGAIPVPEALAYAREIATALDYGWQKKRFRHGDIKPENFMVQNNGHVKLADFGLAMVKGHEYQGNEVMLTPHYAAPELIRGQRSADNCLIDIYAFGASLYHMLAGSTPYPGNDAREVMRSHLTAKLEPLCRRNPSIPKYLSDFVGEMMAKNPADRLQDWKMVLSGIDAMVEKMSAGPHLLPDLSSMSSQESRIQRERRQLQARFYQNYHRRRVRSVWLKYGLPLLGGAAVVLLLLAVCFFQAGQRKKQWRTPQVAAPSLAPVVGEKKKILPEPEESSSSETAGRGGKLEEAVPMAGVKPPGTDTASHEESEDGVSRLKTLSSKKFFSVDKELEKLAALEEKIPTEKEERGLVSVRLPDNEIPLPEDQNIRNALYLTELQLMLRRFEFVFGDMRSVEALQKAAGDWQERHPDAQGMAVILNRYVMTQMAPLLESYPAFLGRLEPGLRKAKIHMRGQNQPWYRVLQVQLDGIVLEQNFPKGKLRLPLKTWQELEKEGILAHILVVAYKNDPSADRIQRLFHYFLFRGDFARCRILLRETSGKYHAVLSAFLNLHALNSRERRALAFFQEILDARNLGSRALLGKLLSAFEYQNTSVMRRNQKLMEAWLRECSMYVTGNAGAALISEAMKCSSSEPERALECLLRAEGIYPGTYPEAARIQEVYGQIFRRKKTEKAPRRPALSCPFRDFGAAGSHFSRRSRLYVQDGETAPEKTFYQFFVQAEAGLQREDFLDSSFSRNAAPDWQVSWLFARALYDVCTQSSQNTSAFKEIFLQTPAKAEKVGYLLMEYLLMTHRNTLYTADYNLNLYDFLKRIDPEKKILPYHLRFWKLSLAVKLECQQKTAVCHDLDEFIRKFELSEGKIPHSNLEILQQMKLFHVLLQKKSPDAGEALRLLLQKHPGASCEDLRLFFACCGRASLNEAADEAFLNWYGRIGSHADLLAGNVLYDFILRRSGHELSRGDAAAAVKLADEILSAKAVHLWMYFARFHFLRSGLLCLGNSDGPLIDAESLLRQSAWAGDKERSLIRVSEDHRVEIQNAGAGNYLCFWEDWLNACLKVRKNSVEKMDFTIGKDTMKAESVLMEGLRLFHKDLKYTGR